MYVRYLIFVLAGADSPPTAFAISSYFLCHVAEQVKKYGLLLLGFTPVNRSDWFLREK